MHYHVAVAEGCGFHLVGIVATHQPDANQGRVKAGTHDTDSVVSHRGAHSRQRRAVGIGLLTGGRGSGVVVSIAVVIIDLGVAVGCHRGGMNGHLGAKKQRNG